MVAEVISPPPFPPPLPSCDTLRGLTPYGDVRAVRASIAALWPVETGGNTGNIEPTPNIACFCPSNPAITQAMRCPGSLVKHKITASADATQLVTILRFLERPLAQASPKQGSFERITSAFGHEPQAPSNEKVFGYQNPSAFSNGMSTDRIELN